MRTATASGGNHAICTSRGPGAAMAPQDRAASLATTERQLLQRGGSCYNGGDLRNALPWGPAQRTGSETSLRVQQSLMGETPKTALLHRNAVAYHYTLPITNSLFFTF